MVGIVLGSDSDLDTMLEAVKVLDALGVGSEVVVASAHRTPQRTEEWASGAAGRGLRVLIAAAGGAAALPGVVAAFSSLPVIGVPIAATPLNGLDALLSIVQMPKGVPVATVAIGAWGAANAGHPRRPDPGARRSRAAPSGWPRTAGVWPTRSTSAPQRVAEKLRARRR